VEGFLADEARSCVCAHCLVRMRIEGGVNLQGARDIYIYAMKVGRGRSKK
jgi:hypothetical protein